MITVEPHVPIPAPEQHLFFARCPRCRCRIWNQLFSRDTAYRVHYLDHILDDLIKQRRG